MIEIFIDGLGQFVALGFALTLLAVAWVVPVAAILGVIAICAKGADHE